VIGGKVDDNSMDVGFPDGGIGRLLNSVNDGGKFGSVLVVDGWVGSFGATLVFALIELSDGTWGGSSGIHTRFSVGLVGLSDGTLGGWSGIHTWSPVGAEDCLIIVGAALGGSRCEMGGTIGWRAS